MTELTKRIPVTGQTLERLKKMGHKGQTYDQLLNEMADVYSEYTKKKLIEVLKDRDQNGVFIEFDEAFE